MKLHISDIRLYNNAGIDMPVCKAGARLLDMDATRYPTVSTDDIRHNKVNMEEVCKHCLRAWEIRYGDWASLKGKEND